jgi:putative N6-adenine-specific DNA methylase
MLLASGWGSDTPLIDPMCGSGTIPIEGALLARRVAPGIGRSFAFERWPESSTERSRDRRAEARSIILPKAPCIIRGSDRDAGAIDSARANAERAGVLGDIDFAVQPLSKLVCPRGRPALVASNPPYGVRVGEVEGLRDLYARLGQVVRAQCAGSRLAILSGNPRLEGQLRLPLRELLRTRNGGIPVKVLMAEIDA